MNIDGTDPSAVRQLLLQHALLPLVSIASTHHADRAVQAQCDNPLVSCLQMIKPYGNNALYPTHRQGYRITNTALITKNYTLFPVRFELPLADLLALHGQNDDKIKSLFSISSLEVVMQSLSQSHTDLYAEMFQKLISSNHIVLFDTFNHPVLQVFVVDAATDSLDAVRTMIVEFRNNRFPKYFQISDLLIHVFVLHGPSVTASQVAKYQESLRTELSVQSTVIPLPEIDPKTRPDPDSLFRLPQHECLTIEQEVQAITLHNTNNEPKWLVFPKELDCTLRSKIYDFLLLHLIPHMERKIRTWDDLVLSPKKSITGRFFSVSRKLFNNNDHTPSNSTTTPGSYNTLGNLYHRSAPEQIIRKLADWTLMLKDFKYAYSTYDFIKKNFTADKAWVYVAASQEMCIVSLLLAQTQQLTLDTLPLRPDKNLLRKIRHDIIEPYIDNLSYTFKLRYNIKTYAIRTYIIVAELLMHMSIMFNIPWWWSDLIETYFLKAVYEMDTHLPHSNDEPKATRAILFERLGYAKLNSNTVPTPYMSTIVDIFEKGIVQAKVQQVDEGFYKNPHKLLPDNDAGIEGLTRFRKSALWYIISMREWHAMANLSEVHRLMRSIKIPYNVESIEGQHSWFNRGDLVLSRLSNLGEFQKSNQSTDAAQEGTIA